MNTWSKEPPCSAATAQAVHGAPLPLRWAASALKGAWEVLLECGEEGVVLLSTVFTQTGGARSVEAVRVEDKVATLYDENTLRVFTNFGISVEEVTGKNTAANACPDDDDVIPDELAIGILGGILRIKREETLLEARSGCRYAWARVEIRRNICVNNTLDCKEFV